MVCLLFYLAQNPTLTLLIAKIRTTIPSYSSIHSRPLLSSCRYLWACIDEALRLVPGVPGTLPQEILPPGLVVRSPFIHAGTVIGFPISTIHYYPSHYDDPSIFNLGQWSLSKESDPEKGDPRRTADSKGEKRASSAVYPFSIGQRACLREGFAYTEASVTIAALPMAI